MGQSQTKQITKGRAIFKSSLFVQKYNYKKIPYLNIEKQFLANQKLNY